jgi:ketosteroid isomerase-like protein
MGANSTEDVVRSFHQELWGAGDVSAVDRYVAPDAVVEMTGSEGATVEVLRADVDRYFAAFDEVSTEILDFMTVADQRIVAMHSFWDAATVYRQFGLLPSGL